MGKPKDRSNSGWEQLLKDTSGLCDGASENTLQDTEKKLVLKLPQSFRNFLAWRDGGFVADKRFLLYSAGKGIHPEETLIASNMNRPSTYPLFNIARDATYEFGFKKDELRMGNPKIFAYHRDFDELDNVAETFEEFMSKMDKMELKSKTS